MRSAGKIEAEFDAVFLGVGLGAMHRLAVEGAAASAGMIDALEFIAAYKTGERLSVAPRVVVIGAGNTAIDAACAAKRLGAEEVTILYRRQRENISAFDFEYDHALREGVKFVWGTLLMRLTADERGMTFDCIRVEQDAKGVLAPIEGSEFTIECDVVIPGDRAVAAAGAAVADSRRGDGARSRGDRPGHRPDHQPQILRRRRLRERRARGGRCRGRRQARGARDCG
jgi:NADPH-dependent glutamate synthase beta subunit-like oxidoreductase